MTTNEKIHNAFNPNPSVGFELNEFTPKNGVTKAVSKSWFKRHGGNFNSDLYDRICDIKLLKK